MEIISFIVPTYNPNVCFFNEAIDSILNQDSKAFEIIIVDDGSKDKTFLEKYKNNPKIKIIIDEHVGLAHTRNVGVSFAKAPFISFVDCDDLVSPFFVSLFEKIAKQNNISNDIVMFASVSDKRVFDNYKLYCSCVPSFTYNNSNLSDFIYRGKSNKKALPFIEERSSWSKIYPTKLVHDVYFDENVQSYGEDVIFNWKIYNQVNRLLCFDKVFAYYYRENQGSLVRRYVPNMEQKICNLVSALEKEIDNRDDFWKKQLSLDCFNVFLFNICKFSIFAKDNNESNKDKYKRFNFLVYKSPLSTHIINLKTSEVISRKKQLIHFLLKIKMKHFSFLLLKGKYK